MDSFNKHEYIKENTLSRYKSLTLHKIIMSPFKYWLIFFKVN